ncbi:MAG: MFS transporter [Caldicoprobacterales bacterium]
MVTALLIIIYIIYISLGVPDSLFGAAWPAIYIELNFPISLAGYISMVTSGCTVVSSILSASLINKIGVGKVTAISTFLTAVALILYSFSNHVAFFFLLSVVLGFGAGAIDSGLNNFIALHYKANQMNFLHCFYGIGVFISPYLMSIALSNNSKWRNGYQYAFILQLCIAIIAILALPLWSKVDKEHNREKETSTKTLTVSQMLQTPGIRASLTVFLCSDSILCLCGTWSSTYLVNSIGFPVDVAAKFVAIYFLGLAIGRFASGILTEKLSVWKIIHIGKWLVLTSIIILILPSPRKITPMALFLIGLGIGPVFPNLTHLTPKMFGEDVSQSVMGAQMASAYTGIMTMPTIFGAIAQIFGVNVFPWFLLLLFVLMAFSLRALVGNLNFNNVQKNTSIS